MMGFKVFHSAQATIAGIETAHMIRRKLVLGIPAQASSKNLTRLLMPSAPRFVLVPTQQGVGTLAPNDLTPCRMAFYFVSTSWLDLPL
jgi:hypothetical protein